MANLCPRCNFDIEEDIDRMGKCSMPKMKEEWICFTCIKFQEQSESRKLTEPIPDRKTMTREEFVTYEKQFEISKSR